MPGLGACAEAPLSEVVVVVSDSVEVCVPEDDDDDVVVDCVKDEDEVEVEDADGVEDDVAVVRGTCAANIWPLGPAI